MLAVTVTAGADMAIRQGKVLLQNVEDFYAWAKQTEENGSKIKYLFYNQEDVDNGDKILQEKEKPMRTGSDILETFLARA
jgi:nucleoid-associated protein YejK